MTAPASRRYITVDVAKGVAIIMVVLYHSALFLRAEGVTTIGMRASAVLELYPMPALFLLAGLFATSVQAASFGRLIQRKVWPLLYLYILWSVIRFGFFALVPVANADLGELSARDPRHLLVLLWWPSSSYWFLYVLAIFRLVGWLLKDLPRWLQVLPAAVLSASMAVLGPSIENEFVYRLGLYAVFYLIGMAYSRAIFAAIASARLWQGIALLAVTLAIGYAILLGLWRIPGLVLIGQLASVAGGLVVVRSLESLRAAEVVAKLGRGILGIYILHLFIIATVAGLIGLFDPDWPRAVDTIIVLALAIAAVAASIRLGGWLRRFTWLWIPPWPRRQKPKDRSRSNAAPPQGPVRTEDTYPIVQPTTHRPAEE